MLRCSTHRVKERFVDIPPKRLIIKFSFIFNQIKALNSPILTPAATSGGVSD
jgi:hypothetical protein